MSEEHQLILKMLEEGKITVDEAERLLAAVRTKPQPQSQTDFVKDFTGFFEGFGKKLEGMFKNDFQGFFGGGEEGQEYSAPTETQRFETGEEAELNLLHRHGSVSVTAWDQPAVEIATTKKVRAEDSEVASQILEQIQIGSTHDGKCLSLQTVYPEDQGLWQGKRQASVEYTIRVPQQTAAQLNTQHGNTSVQQIAGPVALESRHGNVDVQEIEKSLRLVGAHGNVKAHKIGESVEVDRRHGNLSLSDIGADVTINHEHGKLDMDHVHGNAQVKRAHGKTAIQNVAGAFNVLQRHGSVSVDAVPPAEAECQIEGSHATVRLTIPGSDQTYIHASTHHGRIHSAFDGQYVDERVGQELRVGDSNMPLKIILKSHHANIHVDKKGEESDE